ncbi:ATP-binding protein [Propionivibrio sp.]|uniref:AlbA family DNA-binding domain-containing protein n=1 Tax=Propionivibrio sp. TaxID=2212460 RepID=UPI002626EEB2|nr:ATP-binding protein [Propionivibrio sp.]
MLSIFTKPIENITAADVRELIEHGTPENYQVEYKRDLPTDNRHQDTWRTAKEINTFSSDKILGEIVAFANAMGGTLILGIKETHDKPPRAGEITPLPHVADLAQRFEDKATTIEPPLFGLKIWPVVMDDTSEEKGGVVIFRVPQSNRAPHRLSTNGKAFVRTGTSARVMDMRQIQDMTLNVARGNERIEETFLKRREDFEDWATSKVDAAFIRVTALPVSTLPNIPRIHKNNELYLFSPYCEVELHGTPYHASMRYDCGADVAILRGSRRYNDNSSIAFRYDMLQDGLVDFWCSVAACESRPNDPYKLKLWHDLVLSGIAAVFKGAEKLKEGAGAPDTEYVMDVEIFSHNRRPVEYQPLGDGFSRQQHVLKNLPLFLPKLQFNSRADFAQLIDTVDRDIYDELGLGDPSPSLKAKFQ